MSDKVENWVRKQREAKPLGRISLYQQNLLERLPLWSWDFGEGSGHCEYIKGQWTYECGWMVVGDKIVYHTFKLGKPWPHDSVYGREQQEAKQVADLIDREWSKLKTTGWKKDSLAVVDRKLKGLTQSWTRYSVGELAEEWRKNLKFENEQDMRTYHNVGEGQHKGKETLINRVKTREVYLGCLVTIVKHLKSRTALAELDSNAPPKIDGMNEQATLLEFMNFARTFNAWNHRVNGSDRGHDQNSPQIASWIERRTNAVKRNS